MEQSTIIRIIRIALILLVLGLFIWFIMWLFSPKESEEPAPEQPVDTSAQVEQFATVRYVQDGQITAPEQHYSIIVTVNAFSRRLEVVQGYNASVIRSQNYENTTASYDAFYAAIKNVGFFVEREDTSGSDRTSVCPLGVRYSYLAGSDISNPTLNTWGASCGAKIGTFGGNAGQVKTLFKDQIPDYSTLTKDISL